MNKIILYLLTHLMFLGTLFASGAPAIVAGGEGGDDDAAGDDAALDDDGADDQGDGSESGDESTDDAVAGEGAEKTEADKAAADAKAGKLDNRQLPQSVRNMMTELQKTDPKAHGFLKDVLFRDRELTKVFPGGLAEAKKFKDTVATIEKDFPGGIEPVKQELSEYRGLDEAYAAGDPKVLDIWVEANPEAFKKLVPLAMNRYAREDSAGYQRFGAELITNTLKGSGVLHTLNYLNRSIAAGDKEGATELLKEVTDWIGSIDELAKKKPEAANVQDQALTQREQRIKAEEDRLWNTQTAGPINKDRSDFIRKEAIQYLPKDVTMDDELADAIEAEVQRRADKILMDDSDFIEKLNAYTEAKDGKGLRAYMKQKLQEILKSAPGKPGPIEGATKFFFRNAAPAKAGTGKPGQKPGQGGTRKLGTPPAQGWTKVSPDKAPRPEDIDKSATTFEMGMAKQAILKNGKKFYWGDVVPA